MPNSEKLRWESWKLQNMMNTPIISVKCWLRKTKPSNSPNDDDDEKTVFYLQKNNLYLLAVGRIAMQSTEPFHIDKFPSVLS